MSSVAWYHILLLNFKHHLEERPLRKYTSVWHHLILLFVQLPKGSSDSAGWNLPQEERLAHKSLFRPCTFSPPARAALAEEMWAGRSAARAMFFLPRPVSNAGPSSRSPFLFLQMAVCNCMSFNRFWTLGRILGLRWLFLHHSHQGGFSPCLSLAKP